MKISQKLQIIKDLSGLTQEKLARQLSVSFATLNSWINERSLPHKRHQNKIDEFYYKQTGQKLIIEDVLLAKKDIIKNKSKKINDIIKFIKENHDIYDELVLALTYNSNSIEGSTLTKEETADIIFGNLALPNKDLKEHLEAKNHQLALKYLFNSINYEFKITEDFILKLHEILMNGILEDAGKYRNHAVRILGTNVPTANFLKVSVLMKELIRDINKKNKDNIAHASQIHSRFEKIHPFSDGNGRIGRILIHAMLLRKKIAPAVIKQKKKRLYYRYLRASQLKNEYKQLEEFISDAVLIGFNILERKIS
ncbi:MAG: Fic family protein [Candidatus Portnoybacteria bacterium]|nr:Fic family protein [Candidatus Portnoybacteria bacterium]